MFDQQLANSEEYLRTYISSFGEGNLEALLENGNKLALDFKARIEGRTRNTDPTEAMRLRVHDPLWMLARQWQMGEFRGNNTGTAMSVRCAVRYQDCSDDPIEPTVERVNPYIDFLTKIESAVYFLDLLKNSSDKGAQLVKHYRPVLIKYYPINWDWIDKNLVLPDAVTSEQECKLNKHLQNYARTYRGKIFDGEMLFYNLAQKGHVLDSSLVMVEKSYVSWFSKRFSPISPALSQWEDADLCYSAKTTVAGVPYVGDRYQGGRLSWYSFDCASQLQNMKKINQEQVLSLPTPATFASAPNKRLWQMEDRKVFMGNSVEEPSEANSVVMRYTTMYSNDWMLFPLKTEIGKYISVDEIEVVDTFGGRHIIRGDDRAGNHDVHQNKYEEPWQVFVNSTIGKRQRAERDGFYFAPQLAATIEGKPVEEIKILRDEIANMVWGVENIVSDGCGGTMDANLYATQLETIVNSQNKAGEPEHQPDTVVFGQGKSPELVKAPGNNAPQAKFSYSLQSSVPFNWIPFIPQRLSSEESKNLPFFMGGREIILRRGKMPCYIFNGEKFELNAVRPRSTIMRPKVEQDKNGNVVKEHPMVIHEEAVQATGLRLTKNFQRARWIGGKTYQWLGIYKRQAKTDASSGLIFDTLKKR